MNYQDEGISGSEGQQITRKGNGKGNGGKRRLDREEVTRLIDSGWSVSAIARKFDVQKSSVSKMMTRLKLSVNKEVTMVSAPTVVSKNLNTVDQLQKINTYANDMLDLLMRWQKGEPDALQILEGQVKMVKTGGDEPEWVKEFKFKDPRELALKAMVEIRQQLALQTDIFKTLYDLQQIAAFQQTVLEIIGSLQPAARKAIVDELHRKKALRQSVTI